jgi:hypothetical protein
MNRFPARRNNRIANSLHHPHPIKRPTTQRLTMVVVLLS